MTSAHLREKRSKRNLRTGRYPALAAGVPGAKLRPLGNTFYTVECVTQQSERSNGHVHPVDTHGGLLRAQRITAVRPTAPPQIERRARPSRSHRGGRFTYDKAMKLHGKDSSYYHTVGRVYSLAPPPVAAAASLASARMHDDAASLASARMHDDPAPPKPCALSLAAATPTCWSRKDASPHAKWGAPSNHGKHGCGNIRQASEASASPISQPPSTGGGWLCRCRPQRWEDRRRCDEYGILWCAACNASQCRCEPELFRATQTLCEQTVQLGTGRSPPPEASTPPAYRAPRVSLPHLATPPLAIFWWHARMESSPPPPMVASVAVIAALVAEKRTAELFASTTPSSPAPTIVDILKEAGRRARSRERRKSLPWTCAMQRNSSLHPAPP